MRFEAPLKADIPQVFEEPQSILYKLYPLTLEITLSVAPAPLTTQDPSQPACLHDLSPHLPSWVTIKILFSVPQINLHTSPCRISIKQEVKQSALGMARGLHTHPCLHAFALST